MNKIEEQLFSKKLGKNGPLFQRPVDLVRSLMSHPSSKYFQGEKSEEFEKKFNNLKVYVSQVLKGKRNASDELISSLNNILKELVDRETKEKEIVIEETLTLLSRNSNIFASSGLERELDELNKLNGNSKTQVVFSSRPVETYDNKRGFQSTDSILESLQIYNEVFDIDLIDTRYEFHFANPLYAIEFYDRLFSRALILKGKTFEQTFNSRFKELNSLDIINIYIVDDIYCVFPHTIFNHTLQNISGFIFFSLDSDNFSIAKISEAALHRWYRNLYLVVKFNRKEIVFQEYLELKNHGSNKKQFLIDDLLKKDNRSFPYPDPKQD